MNDEEERKKAMREFSDDELMQEINRRAAINFPDCKHDWETYHYMPRAIRECRICKRGEYV